MDDKDRFVDLARRVGRALVRLERDEVCCTLTLQQYDTLTLLETGPATTRTIARHFDVDLSTASRNLTVLAKKRLVRRTSSPEDRRATTNALTEAGRSCLRTLSCDGRMVMGHLLTRIPAGQRASVVRALERLQSALMASDDRGACCSPRRAGSRT